jgi:cell division protein FtsB
VAAGSRRTGLTHRAAVLVLVVTTLLLSAALPLRSYLEQRSTIAELEQEAASARTHVAGLEQAKRELEDPAHIAAEARRRLHMTRPGEVTYVLITPPPAPPADPEQPAGAGPETPWWSQVWQSVESADRPPPAAEPAPEAEPAPAPPAP